jgi:hypothetical protein
MAGLLVLRLSGNFAAWDDRGRFLLATGLLTFFLLLAPIRERDPHPKKDQRGSTAFAVLTAGLLIWQGRRVWSRTRAPANR